MRYVFPLYRITKKELTLYLELVAPELNRQGTPGRFTTGPDERSMSYAMTDACSTCGRAWTTTCSTRSTPCSGTCSRWWRSECRAAAGCTCSRRASPTPGPLRRVRLLRPARAEHGELTGRGTSGTSPPTTGRTPTTSTTPARTAAEVDYLAAVLDRYAPGRRVARPRLRRRPARDGPGRARVRRHRSRRQPVRARPCRQPRPPPPGCAWTCACSTCWAEWDVPAADAVMCVQAFGWGSDADQLALLRRVRRALAPGGVLVLDHSNVLAIAADLRARVARRHRRDELPLPPPVRPGHRAQQRRGTRAARRRQRRRCCPTTSGCTSRPRWPACWPGPGSRSLRADAEFTIGAPVTIGQPVRAVRGTAGGRGGVGAGRAPAAAGRRARPALGARRGGVRGSRSSRRPGPRCGSGEHWPTLRRYDLADPYGGARHAGPPRRSGRRLCPR